MIAVRDIPMGRMATMYSLFLYRIPDQAMLYKKLCTDNTTKSDEYRRHCKKYTLMLSLFGAIINLPPELDTNPLPNLGKKMKNFVENSELEANHS